MSLHEVAVHVLEDRRGAGAAPEPPKRLPRRGKPTTIDEWSRAHGLDESTLVQQIDRTLDTTVWRGTKWGDRATHFYNTLSQKLTGEMEKSLLAQESFRDFEARMLKSLGVENIAEPAGALRDMEVNIENEARTAWNTAMRAMQPADPDGLTMLVWRSALIPTTTPQCAARHGRLISEIGEVPQMHIGCLCDVITAPNADADDEEIAAAGQAVLDDMAAERADWQSTYGGDAMQEGRLGIVRWAQGRMSIGPYHHPATIDWDQQRHVQEAFDPDQPRDEQGRWTDGGGGGVFSGTGDGAPPSSGTPTTGEYAGVKPRADWPTADKGLMVRLTKSGSGGGSANLPPIATGAGDFLVRIELEDAELPLVHYDGIRAINFADLSELGASGKTIVGKGDVYGLYSPEQQTITLAFNSRSNLSQGTTNVGVFGGATVLHEVGHHVHIAKLTDAAADEWAAYSQNGERAAISNYARTNRGEHFAECYRAYARGGSNRARLKTLEPKAYAYMRRLWNDPKMFYGQGYHVNEGMARYNG